MSIFDKRARAELQEMKSSFNDKLTAAERRASELASDRARLDSENTRLVKINEFLHKDILTLTETSSSYVGNEYRDYATAVQEISDKYTGQAAWGVIQTGAIIDLRAAFILGDGIKVVHRTATKAEAQAELDWAEAFLAYNALDEEMAQEIAKEAEIEGKVALTLKYDEAAYEGETKPPYPGMVSVRYLSWLAKKYTVTADPNDYLWYKAITWKAGSNYAEGNLAEDEFVYKKFGGRIYDPNDAQPKLMKCLTQVDRLDKALRDLREINHLFASQTPNFQCETAQEAAQLWDQIKDTNWKIGKAIVHVGEFNMVGPAVEGVQNLVSEIELNTKMISGTTGVPIHYLGLLDLLKNRATGDNSTEMVMAATSRERSIWIGAYEELLEKAMRMWNAKAQKSPLDPSKIGIEIPLISEQHWVNIQNVLIPAATAGIVSKEFVAAQIPGVDLEEEAERREEAENTELEQAKSDLERIRQDKQFGDEED